MPGLADRSDPGLDGFTIIELMMVLSIIILVMSLTLGAYVYIVRTTKETRCTAQIKAMELAFEQFRRDNKYYYQKITEGALGLADFNQLVDSNGNNYIDFTGLQFQKDTTYGYVDPWGNPFRYHCPGQMNSSTFDIFTYGVDGQPGEAGVDDDSANGIDDAAEAQTVGSDFSDDISNWKK